MLVVAWWIVRLQHDLWRRRVWRQVGEDIQGLATEHGAAVDPVRTGYRVRWAAGEVEWRAGLWGERTRVSLGGQVQRAEGLLGREALAGLTSAGAPAP